MVRIQHNTIERDTLMCKRNAQYIGALGTLRSLREKPAMPYELIAEVIAKAFNHDDLVSIIKYLNREYEGKYNAN